MNLRRRARSWATDPTDLNLPKPLMAYAPHGMVLILVVVMLVNWLSSGSQPAQIEQQPAEPPPIPVVSSTTPSSLAVTTIPDRSEQPTSIPDSASQPTQAADPGDIAKLAAEAAYSGDCSSVPMVEAGTCPPPAGSLYYPQVKSVTLLATSADRRLYEAVYTTDDHPPQLLALVWRDTAGWVWDPDGV